MSDQQNQATRRVIMLVVTGVWAASFIADIAITDYHPSPYIHAAMMAIIGALFGREMLGKTGRRNGD